MFLINTPIGSAWVAVHSLLLSTLCNFSTAPRFQPSSKVGSLVLFLLISGTAEPAFSDLKSTVREIRSEALQLDSNSSGHALPLAASWNTGIRGTSGYSPDWQLTMIEQGHHLWPWFQLDPPLGRGSIPTPGLYYPKALKRSAELGLPIAFISTQWERLLSENPIFLNLPPESNPNVVGLDYKILPKVSPFGPVQPWRTVGTAWTNSEWVRRMQSWYPDPPRVLFISNNEHAKLQWKEARSDRRYSGQDGEAARVTVADGWIARYRAMIAAMRSGLTNGRWKENSVFIGYNAFGGSAFGRWPRWIDYSLISRGRLDPWQHAWEGASLSYYVNDWNQSTDYQVWSPQIEAMNWVFMVEEARQVNPNFWIEISVWDGYQPGRPSDKRLFYERLGQVYSPERYAGMVKFGMWLLRPRIVREFRNPNQTVQETGDYFMSIVRSIDEIYENPVLESFWRHGRLVPNRAQKHPYQTGIPEEYATKDRWFLLDSRLDPPRPWGVQTRLRVFSLALVKGKYPNREWLIYVNSPLESLYRVGIRVPEYGEVEVDSRPTGSYYLIHEQKHRVQPLPRG